MEDSVKLHLYDKMKTVALDIGFKYTKLGFSGEPNPRFIIPTEITHPGATTSMQVLDACDEDDLYDNLAQFLKFAFFKKLLVNPKDTIVVVVESLLCPSLLRETLAKVLFTHLQAVGLLYVPSHMVAAYTLAVPTALSIDMGYQEICVIPVYEGYPILNAYQSAPIGGLAIEKEIRKLLEEYYTYNDPSRLPTVHSLSDKIIEEIKASLCFVAPFEKVNRTDKETTRPPDVSYPLPDNRHLVIPGSIREDACEVLFRPDIDGVCLPAMILDAVLACSIDARRVLSESLLLFGGTAMLPGLRKRLSSEILDLLKCDKYKDKIHLSEVKLFSPPSQDNYTAWLGGAILGATQAVSIYSVMKDEYKKQGDMPDWVSLKYNIRNSEVSRTSRLL